ncbi:MAG: 2-amino-4-hydroxy-6-hydroxymethyldihydropteridine diphosphokinase [Mixta sp.]
MNRVYLALGSNLADPLHQVRNALDALNAIPQTQRVAVSSFYRTPPYGPPDQPDYLNAAVALDTQLTPEALLDHTQRIELEQGRVRKAERWGPRTLDLDIMLFGEQVLNTARVTVPHYDMLNRAFMLVPLLEIAPQARLPDGRYLADIARQLDCSAILPW